MRKPCLNAAQVSSPQPVAFVLTAEADPSKTTTETLNQANTLHFNARQRCSISTLSKQTPGFVAIYTGENKTGKLSPLVSGKDIRLTLFRQDLLQGISAETHKYVTARRHRTGLCFTADEPTHLSTVIVEETDTELRSRMRKLAEIRCRFGFAWLHVMLHWEEFVINHKHTKRAY